MKRTIVSIFLLLPFIYEYGFTDELHPGNGTVLQGKVILEMPSYIEFQREGRTDKERFNINIIDMIVYDIGSESHNNILKSNDITTENVAETLKSNDQLTSDSTSKRVKSSWYIGFSLGFSPGRCDAWLYRSPSDYIGFYGNFGVGAIINSNIFIGFQLSEFAPGSMAGNDNTSTTNYQLTLCYFPDERGFFLKSGIGYSELELSPPTYRHNPPEHITTNGIAVSAGLGYYFQLGRTFNLGLTIEYTRGFYWENCPFSTVDLMNAYVSFYWF